MCTVKLMGMRSIKDHICDVKKRRKILCHYSENGEKIIFVLFCIENYLVTYESE